MDSRRDNVIVDEPVKRPEPVMHAGQRVEDALTSEQPANHTMGTRPNRRFAAESALDFAASSAWIVAAKPAP
ncbi:unnamed protein product [Parascedosporium putredinis]|uniref:Uncharacterized protein n=1 Tax=Parascedosporium putredinis TaxID=1442378 RepID=A0A9P1MEC9_9PEZI|nr:unnamed protein product [Parascedosporium putredinis]CAI8004363.1 unnamed protein product [Parascedosporium putredinis]